MSFTERIKALFNEEAPSNEENKSLFLDVKSEDKMFRIEGEELVEGAYIVELVIETSEEGEVTEVTKQIEDGEYILEDGKSIVVEGDLIKSITEVSEEEEVKEEVVVEGPVDDMFSKTVTESFEKMKSTIDSLLEEVKGLNEFNNSLKSEMESMKSDFSNQLEEVKKLPADKGVSFSKQGFKFNKTEKTDYSKLQEISSKYRK